MRGGRFSRATRVRALRNCRRGDVSPVPGHWPIQNKTGSASPARYCDVPGPVDVKAIRAKSGLSQSEFAGRYGFNVRTLQEWELGRTEPPSAIRACLTVIDLFPETVERALKGAA